MDGSLHISRTSINETNAQRVGGVVGIGGGTTTVASSNVNSDERVRAQRAKRHKDPPDSCNGADVLRDS
ncbi:hypothetical protein [Streptomyces sp. NPDC058695]|uniref:hypothetical protein n=1 Tax=Streptomyces sp. NPDC058695 TaxID=3346604 RepID=UPI00364DA744